MKKILKLGRMKKNRKKGFTLVELVANMAIIGIVMVMVTTITSVSLSSFSRQKRKLDAVAVAEVVSDKLKSELEKVKSVNVKPMFMAETHKNEDGSNVVDEFGNVIYFDQTGADTTQTLIGCNMNGTRQYPVSLEDLKSYSSIYLKPNNKNIQNAKMDKDFAVATGRADADSRVSGEDRRGKVYVLRQKASAKVEQQEGWFGWNYYTSGYMHDGSGGQLEEVPLIDESLYRGYDVDVKFQYIGKTDDKGDLLTSPSAIKVYIDVYDGDKIVYSTTSSVTFIKKQDTGENTQLKVYYDKNTWNVKKDVVTFIR